MKIGYSQISLLLFVASIIFKAVGTFASASPVLSVLFFVCLFLGIALIAVETFGQKNFAPAFNFENKFHLSFFAAAAALGLFADFVSDALALYGIVNGDGYNIAVGAVTVGAQGAFALLGAVCMIMVSLSFKKDTRYDFRELKLLNISPLLWAVSKGVLMLTELENGFSATEVVRYIAVISAIAAFFFFAKEVDSKGGAAAVSVFSFRMFAYFAVMYFICRLCDMLGTKLSPIDGDSFFSYTMLLTGAFAYFLEKNILSYTKIN